jgi:hypothetical protein
VVHFVLKAKVKCHPLFPACGTLVHFEWVTDHMYPCNGNSGLGYGRDVSGLPSYMYSCPALLCGAAYRDIGCVCASLTAPRVA